MADGILPQQSTIPPSDNQRIEPAAPLRAVTFFPGNVVEFSGPGNQPLRGEVIKIRRNGDLDIEVKSAIGALDLWTIPPAFARRAESS